MLPRSTTRSLRRRLRAVSCLWRLLRLVPTLLLLVTPLVLLTPLLPRPLVVAMLLRLEVSLLPPISRQRVVRLHLRRLPLRRRLRRPTRMPHLHRLLTRS